MTPASAQITRKAKSNLAFALLLLPREKRRDTEVFYAYCRTIDDIADEPGVPIEQRISQLDAWQDVIMQRRLPSEPLQEEILTLLAKHQLDPQLLGALIEGCRSDLVPRHFPTWHDLSQYIWQVACSVGLVSTRLFGCRDSGTPAYAEALGRALQLTNILRDIREDHENGNRLYLPLEDLAAHGLGPADISSAIQGDPRFLALMKNQASRAHHFFRQAHDMLPPADHEPLAPARAMAAIYGHILETMQRDGFRVFEKNYRLSTLQKAKHLVQETGSLTLLRNQFA